MEIVAEADRVCLSGEAVKRGIFLVLFVGGGMGCGPIEYLNQVTRRAAQAQAAAEKAEAEKYAPYEYWTSREYLHKARELAGYARFQLAIRYGRKAEEAALKARDMALEAQTRQPALSHSPRPESERSAPLPDEGAKSE